MPEEHVVEVLAMSKVQPLLTRLQVHLVSAQTPQNSLAADLSKLVSHFRGHWYPGPHQSLPSYSALLSEYPSAT